MKTQEFNKLKKELKPEMILTKYMENKIKLTDLQLDKICLISPGHGGCKFRYKEVKNENNN